MKKSTLLFTFFIFSLISFPILASAVTNTGIWGSLTCNQSGGRPCGFCDAIILIRNIINYLFKIAIPLAVGMIVWGAIRIIFAGASEKNLTEGKSTMVSALVGLAIALGAWVIVNTILHIITDGIDFPWNSITCS